MSKVFTCQNKPAALNLARKIEFNGFEAKLDGLTVTAPDGFRFGMPDVPKEPKVKATPKKKKKARKKAAKKK